VVIHTCRKRRACSICPATIYTGKRYGTTREHHSSRGNPDAICARHIRWSEVV
jgi:hypothetical protein